MELLERDSALRILGDCFREATTGAARIALVHGEAGIGKTTLVESFLAAHGAEARILLGQCDSLFTPQPLGPLYDIAQQTNGALLQLMQSSDGRLAIFAALLRDLQDSRAPTVLVFEDVHWADAATLDLLKYLGRRMRASRTLIILTYRDDELDGSHALLSVLGSLPAEATRRLHIGPLTQAAVHRLARDAGGSAEQIYLQTGGNPFYVTELLASSGGSIPATVREATLARAMRLSPAARAVLEYCSVVPNRVEAWLVEEPVTSPSLIQECLATGLMFQQGDALMFRHELARQAIESSLPPSRLRSLHESVLCQLIEQGAGAVGTARLVHHATRAGDAWAVRRYAPEAARQASALGAHREAAVHYQTALEHTPADDIDLRATLWEGRGYECSLIDRIDEAIAAREEALKLRRQRNELVKVGDNLRWLSRLAWFRGRGGQARKLATEAVRILEDAPECGELAMAYSNMSQLCMLSEDCREAVQWGERALDLAERLGLTEIVVHALNNIGRAECLIGDKNGRAKLERSLTLALEHQMHEHAVRAYVNLAFQSVENRNYPDAEKQIAAGLAYSRAYDLDSSAPYLMGLRARMNLDRGFWREAEENATPLLKVGTAVARVLGLIVLGCVRVRRGDSEASALLDEARSLALAIGEIMRIGPMAAVRAEAAWLDGDKLRMREELHDPYELALQHPEPWRLGELSLWLSRADALDRPPDGIAEPYRLEISGDWRGAAQVWQRIDCPYEQALALAQGDQDAQLEALDILIRLGAGPAAAIVRRNLRIEGQRGIPRGPRIATKDNPLGLTSRQVEILRLLVGNLSNKEIAARLRISPKTVDHHMVALMAKLGVASRKDAAAHPVTTGLLAKDREPEP